LRTFSGFDRSKSVEDFEGKIGAPLDDRDSRFPDYIRNYSISTLVRNYYSHEGCQDTLANIDDGLFQQIVNEVLFSTISILNYFVNRKKITL
jgi:hypothetical protein